MSAPSSATAPIATARRDASRPPRGLPRSGPLAVSQRTDSGTKAQTKKPKIAGAMPSAARPRQPSIVNNAAEDRPDAAAIEDQPGLAVGQLPLGPDLRQDEGDQKEVEEIEHRDRRQQAKAEPIAPIERRAVEHCQEIVGALPGHQHLHPF